MRAGVQGFTLAWAAAAVPTVEGGGKRRVARSAHDMCQATKHMEKSCGMRVPALVGGGGPALRCRAPWHCQGQTKPPQS